MRIVTDRRIPPRPRKSVAELEDVVRAVLADVKARGDEALREYEEKFDKVSLPVLAVSQEEMDEAGALVSAELKAAIEKAHANIEKFHSEQKFEGRKVEVTAGVLSAIIGIAIIATTVLHRADAGHSGQDSRLQGYRAVHSSPEGRQSEPSCARGCKGGRRECDI